MDPDEFNDFESPADPQLPSPSSPQPQLFHPLSSPPLVPEQPQDDLPAIILQPSYSTLTNAPSQQTGETESTGWKSSEKPALAKMESEHIAEVNHIEVDFSKRTSEGEKKVQSEDSSHLPEFIGINNGQESNISNEGAINSHSLKDFYFENIPQKAVQDSHETHFIIGSHKSELKITKQQSQMQQKKEKKKQAFKPGEEEIGQFGQFQMTQARDEHEQSEIQGIVQAKKEEQQYQHHIQGQIINQEEKEHTSQFKGGCQPHQSERGENHQPIQHLQPLSNHFSEEEEDQFGDFQETVETNLVPPNQHPPNVKDDEHKIDPVLNKVEVYAQRAPLGTVVQQKEGQLQKWVNSLPDYSFMLKEGFNSL